MRSFADSLAGPKGLPPNKLLAAGGALVPLNILLRPPKLYPVAGCAAA
jgi:hypothetical protein